MSAGGRASTGVPADPEAVARRLGELADRRRLTGEECQELTELYVRASADLSRLQTQGASAASIAWLSQRVARARARLLTPPNRFRADVGRFFGYSFPRALYLARWWWLWVSVGFLVLALAVAIWVAGDPEVQRALLSPEEARELVDAGFVGYYSENPAGSFAAQVWTNNAWAAAFALVAGFLFVLPALYPLILNAVNVGVVGGFMAAHGGLGTFFGYITPHGLLELTAVFAAAAAGMRVGWALIAPGPRPRSQAAAQEGRRAVAVALGLVVVLAASGVIEAFVTPSPLPTAVRILIGVAALFGFLAYVWTLGRHDRDEPSAYEYPPYAG